MNISIERLQSCLRIFLTALTMTLVLAACPSTYDTGGSSDGGSSGGNGCAAGYCNSNGLCCLPNYFGCNGSCYASNPCGSVSNSCCSHRTVC